MSAERLDRIRINLALRVDALVHDLLPAARRAGAYFSVGSLQGEPGKSLYIVRRGDKAGTWRDCASGEHGDAIHLIQATQRLDFKAALDWADRWLGDAMVIMRSRHPVRIAVPHDPTWTGDDAQRSIAAHDIWTQARPALGSPVEAYLRFRGIRIAPPASLRFCEVLRHCQGHSGPALVAAIQNSERIITAVQRIWLAPDGQGKAACDPAKKTLGPMTDGAVRLARAGHTLGLAEGIETALSAMQLYSLPVWAVLGASRMDAAALPEDVRNVVIFADHGEAGEKAAIKAQTRYSKEGRDVSIVLPEHGQDFNDMIRAPRRAA